jgi:hypothetical protein
MTITQFSELVARFEGQLSAVNPVLTAAGLPPYYLGFGQAHPEYEWENTPRAIWRWWPMGVALDQLYLRHLPTGRVVNIHGIASGRPFIA